jgi:hypothetical protein
MALRLRHQDIRPLDFALGRSQSLRDLDRLLRYAFWLHLVCDVLGRLHS